MGAKNVVSLVRKGKLIMKDNFLKKKSSLKVSFFKEIKKK